ncbi:S41 family peptidase [Mucilaginibacter pocheonensis]|uniref:C-terminal processing protease CtpA/Prc n=1 Tax=Mucilaginibacter pocheonensis TaxID=398050 RepID=A0ABU1T6E5_9SPHI|nr:S41 family peptidase [Mucilaginibacter pocheonensis]MDR6940811.1 C-terminal processing protease CtpA/Prc [Mucilaginibacter pocheonensis]
MKKLFYFIFIFSVAAISACKKDKGPDKTDTKPTKLQLTEDSVYMFAKEDYYWNSVIPDYNAFNPRQYTGSSDLDALTSEIYGYTKLTKNPLNGNRSYEYDDFNPGTSKYSFIDDGTINDELNGVKGDFGFNYFYRDYTDIRVSLVYAGSPAAAAGLVRGDEIVAINGSSGSAIYITNKNDPANDAGYKFVSNAVDNGSTITLKIQKADGTTVTKELTAKSYTTNPVITYKTYKLSNGKIAGYVVFSSFTSLANAQPKLDAVFTSFASAGVTDVIVDLRYNGGGYVETSAYLSNLLVPSGASGSVMNTTYWTANMQNDKYPLLKAKLGNLPTGYFKSTNADQIEKFSKKGSLNVNRVFFIVTGNTASASELTINNLRPKMDVQLIGETTYGKPVGFISDLVINGYYLFTPEFETKNSAGEGGYYVGMTPEGSTPNGGVYAGKHDSDDLTKNFGDEEEGLLHDALTYIESNKYPASSTVKIQSLSAGITMSAAQKNALAVKTNERKFHGMLIKLPGRN